MPTISWHNQYRIDLRRGRRCARQHADGVARKHQESKDGETAGTFALTATTSALLYPLTVAKKERPQEGLQLAISRPGHCFRQ